MMTWFYSLRLRSADPAKRIQAASNLSHSGSWRAVEPLIRALADNDREVRKEANTSLSALLYTLSVLNPKFPNELRRYGPPETGWPQLSSSQRAIWKRAIRALDRMAAEESLAALVREREARKACGTPDEQNTGHNTISSADTQNDFDLFKGAAMDRLVQGRGFGYEQGVGLLIKPEPARKVGHLVRVTGMLSCHGCGKNVPFTVDVRAFMEGIGMGVHEEAACQSCGSSISFSETPHAVGDARCVIIAARPFVGPSSMARFTLRFAEVSAEEMTE